MGDGEDNHIKHGSDDASSLIYAHMGFSPEVINGIISLWIARVPLDAIMMAFGSSESVIIAIIKKYAKKSDLCNRHI